MKENINWTKMENKEIRLTPTQRFKVVRFFKVGVNKKLDIDASLKQALKDLTPFAYYIYSVLLFADKPDFKPSINFFSTLLEIRHTWTKKFIDELKEKGYVIIRQVDKEVHFIVYYDNLDSIISGSYKHNVGVKQSMSRKVYKKAYNGALKSLERNKKRLEQERLAKQNG